MSAEATAPVVRVTTYEGRGWVRARDAALYLDISIRAFQILVASRQLPPGVKIGGNRRWSIVDLDRAMREHSG